MASYKVSKAWHFGHSLAVDIHKLSWKLPNPDEFDLAVHMRRTAAIAPQKVQESLEHAAPQHRLTCYEAARAALIELQEHLTLARDVHYIDEKLYTMLATKAIVAQRELTTMIQTIKKEQYGTQYNQS